MSCNRALVSSPATIANFGPGFDSFGLCLDKPRDKILVRRMPKGRQEVKVIGKYRLPTKPEKNTASFAAMRLAELCGSPDAGFSMSVTKGMKPGSGLGSSAASSVGGAVGMAALLGVRDKAMILEAAAMGEELVAGSRHFDNVSAALYGGFTVVSDLRKRQILRIKPPQFRIIIAVPEISVETRMARKLLPSSVGLGDAVSNVGWASGMLHAMMVHDVKMIGSCLDDRLALPHRAKLIPGFATVRDAAIDAGALGFSIGGSGPAVFAISVANAQKIRRAMVNAFQSVGLTSESFITVPGTGAKLERLD